MVVNVSTPLNFVGSSTDRVVLGLHMYIAVLLL
jgi:hypothetical protein